MCNVCGAANNIYNDADIETTNDFVRVYDWWEYVQFNQLKDNLLSDGLWS